MSDPDAVRAAREHFDRGLQHLRESAEILRGPLVDPAPAAMATEMALTRAIGTLEATGFMPERGGRR